jgi:hypothetical protein
MSCSEETNLSYCGNKISASGNAANVEAAPAKTNLLVSSSSSSTTVNKTLFGSSRASKVQLSAADPHSVLAAEAVEVLDKMREGADLLRNNTNSFLSGELLPSSLLVGSGQQPSSATSIGNVATAASLSFCYVCAFLYIFLCMCVRAHTYAHACARTCSYVLCV